MDLFKMLQSGGFFPSDETIKQTYLQTQGLAPITLPPTGSQAADQFFKEKTTFSPMFNDYSDFLPGQPEAMRQFFYDKTMAGMPDFDPRKNPQSATQTMQAPQQRAPFTPYTPSFSPIDLSGLSQNMQNMRQQAANNAQPLRQQLINQSLANMGKY